MAWASVQPEPVHTAVVEATKRRARGKGGPKQCSILGTLPRQGPNGFVQQQHLCQTAVPRIIRNSHGPDGHTGAHFNLSAQGAGAGEPL